MLGGAPWNQASNQQLKSSAVLTLMSKFLIEDSWISYRIVLVYTVFMKSARLGEILVFYQTRKKWFTGQDHLYTVDNRMELITR
jgi:hypothetical protein